MTAATDAKFWDKAAPKYAKSRIGDEAGYNRTLERTREFLKPENLVLELGCGTGTTALKLAPSAGTYLATDISSGMIAIANTKLGEHGKANKNGSLTFRTGTAETIAQTGGGFDVVLGFNYLHLVADPAATLATIRGLLKPGGLLITKTVCIGEMNRFIPLLIKVMRPLGMAPASVRSMNEAGVIRLHRDAGFEILVNERHGTKRTDPRPYIVARPV